jgi:hypothetical protein
VGKSHCAKTRMSIHYLRPLCNIVLISSLRTSKKSKSKSADPSARADPAAASPSHLSAIKKEGTEESPIIIGSDDDDVKSGQKRKRDTKVVKNGKMRYIVNIVSFLVIHYYSARELMLGSTLRQHDFHPELQRGIDELKEAIKKGDYCDYVYLSSKQTTTQRTGTIRASSQMESGLFLQEWPSKLSSWTNIMIISLTLCLYYFLITSSP